MNWILETCAAASIDPHRKRSHHHLLQRISLAAIIACGVLLNASCSASEQPPKPATRTYKLHYNVVPEQQKNRIQVQLDLRQSRYLLREIRMSAPAEYFSNFAGDGEIVTEGDQVIWLPPKTGGKLTWSVALNRLKSGHRYDAYMTDDWALFRASDIIPPAATRTAINSRSKTSMSFSLPKGWSAVTEYAAHAQQFRVNNRQRRFDRPTGWILLGDIGIRLEKIAGIKVKIAAPKNHGVRRMDILAFLAWNLPEVTRLFPGFPARLTIVSADRPMWRGGLSAPSSLFINASLPLLSENGTSTLLHEVVHVALGNRAGNGSDWIIEGLAEYYSLKLLLRSGTMSQQRFEHSLARLESWGASAKLCTEQANGAVTAKSAVLMNSLDQELRTVTEGKFNLDDVARAVADQQHAITNTDFMQIVTSMLGAPSEVLGKAGIANCHL